MNIGCHVSIAGGIFNAPERAADLGCECFQVFSRSPQGGKAPELTPEIIKEFKLKIKSHRLKAVYIHTPYYINFASENNRIRKVRDDSPWHRQRFGTKRINQKNNRDASKNIGRI